MTTRNRAAASAACIAFTLSLLATAVQAQTAVAATATATAPAPAPAPAPGLAPGNGKLLLTGGVTSIDGAAGGGLTPWAVIGSYGTRSEIGATAFVTRARTQDYALTTYGAAVGIDDRVEVSVARQNFDASIVAPDAMLRLDIFGVKVKVAGDAVLDADTWMPQVALGVEYKHLNPGATVGAVLDSVAAERNGVDAYVSVSKLFLAQGVLVNGTLRATRANQNGLLGFGSAGNKRYAFKPEASIAYLLRKNLAIGAEYRAKPDQLAFAGAAFSESAWRDVFIAWAPSKNVSVTAAYIALGNIVGHEHQTGGYVSVQLTY